ncbi:MAG: hypothetical protein U0795_11065 [Pirellulales bacterium]
MTHEGNEPHYAVCLIEGGAEGSVCVDVDAFLQFNAWIDERLTELEAQWFVPRFEGSSRHATDSWPNPSSAHGLANLHGLDESDPLDELDELDAEYGQGDGFDDDDDMDGDDFEGDDFDDEDDDDFEAELDDEFGDDFGDDDRRDLNDFRSGFDS